MLNNPARDVETSRIKADMEMGRIIGLYTLLESVEEVDVQLFSLSDVVTDTRQKHHRNESLSRRAFG